MLRLDDLLHYVGFGFIIFHVFDWTVRRAKIIRPPVPHPNDDQHSTIAIVGHFFFFGLLLLLDGTSTRAGFRRAFAWFAILHFLTHCIVRNIRTLRHADWFAWAPIIISGACGVAYLPTAAYFAQCAACNGGRSP